MKFLGLMILLCIGEMRRGVFGESFPECDNLESGSFIGGKSGCKSYIYCDGEDSYEGMCPSQLLFNTKDGSCAPAEEVDCSDNQPATTTTTPATTTSTTTTTKTTTTTTTPVPTTTTTTTTRPVTTTIVVTPPPTTVATSAGGTWIGSPEVPVATDVESSAAIVEEIPEDSGENHTEDEKPLNQPETTSRAPRTTTLAHVKPVAISKPALACPEVDKPNEVVFLPSVASCNEYFVCYHGAPVPMTCSGELFFDQYTAKCDLPDRVNCLIHSATTPNPRKQCTAATVDFFPYPSNCNYFYKCINGFLSLQQCPVNFGWSEEIKLCVKLPDGRCPVRRFG